MARWTSTLALVVALSTAQPFAFAAPATVTVRRAVSPYCRGAPVFRRPAPRTRAPMAPRLQRLVRAGPVPEVVRLMGVAGPARARACKVFDANVNGTADGGEQLVADWRFRLTNARGASTVQTTGDDGCVTFAGLQPGSYVLSELTPPEWTAIASTPRGIEVADPRGRSPSAAVPAMFVSGCIQFARLGSTGYWRGRGGLLGMDERDRQLINSLELFRSPPARRAAGHGPFADRFVERPQPLRAEFEERATRRLVPWQAEVSRFLGDPVVSADPHGRLSQELLAFVLNTRHLLDRAEMVYVEEMPIFVDDLLFEGIVAWHSEKPGWIRDMTGLLAALNGSQVLPYVPHDHCQVAYLPF